MAGRRWWRWALLLTAFLVVHVAIALIDGFDDYRAPGGDVYGVYDYWVYRWQQGHGLVGVDLDWIYPLPALVPILAAAAFGTDTSAYFSTWMLIVLVLDAVALVLLARRRMGLAWWWIGFTALLGPVALARLDSIALPIAIVGVLVALRRPAAASALFTIGAWIKVWPAMLVLALVTALRRSWSVVVAAAAVCAVVLVVGVAVGAGPHLLSFVTAQTGRGIQIESPAALPWLWSGVLRGDDSVTYLDRATLAYQVRGPGVAETAAAMSVVMVVGVAAVVVLVVVARRRGARPEDLLPLAALALVGTVILLNKVGSAQYATWYAAPVLLGLLAVPARFRFPAVLVLVMAALTQLIYPWLSYAPALPFVLALTVRNAFEVVLVGWCLRRLVLVIRASRPQTVPVPLATA